MTVSRKSRLAQLERHELGPRVYLGGRRIHEYVLGLAIGVAGLIAVLVGLLPLDPWGTGLELGAAWLVIKDWRDLFPSSRDTAHWSFGLHRKAESALHGIRRGNRLPALTALAAAGLGLVNLVSALTPNIAWRGHLLLTLEPVEEIRVFHALAVPLSAALLLASFFLLRRRRRAWQAAIALLVALALVNVLKGLDLEEALASGAGACLLLWGRDAFYVRPASLTLRRAAAQLVGSTAAACVLSVALLAVAAPHAGPVTLGREAFALLTWSRGPLRFQDEMRVLSVGIGLIGLAWLGASAWMMFRPLAAPRALPDLRARRVAAGVVAAHGQDTLAFFKLRRDNHLFFSSDERAFLAYRISNGVVLASGDPVGPVDAFPELLRNFRSWTEERGLRLALLGACEELLPVYAEAGLRSRYLGDEAVLDTRVFSLEGRRMRKVRQSVSRLERARYSATLHELGGLCAAELEELEAVAARWRAGAPERGFSMAMDGLRGEGWTETLVVLARDQEGEARGFLHFVPVYGRAAVSLSAMPRDRNSPNGLTEFLVARASELLRQRGIEEVSLNFAVFARLLHAPRNRADRLLSRVIRFANPYFQIESLYRFNAKFFPTWVPRYLVYESATSLPRAGIAALLIEGQLTLPAIGKKDAYAEA